MPRSKSAESGAHDDTSPVHCQASFSQVSKPNSLSDCGMTLNFHLCSPVLAS